MINIGTGKDYSINQYAKLVLKTIIPNAKSIRTHSLLQSSHLLLKFQKYGIENDVSLNLEKTPNLVPHHSKFFNLFRFPFFWGDGHDPYTHKVLSYDNVDMSKVIGEMGLHTERIYQPDDIVGAGFLSPIL